ncbi:MAG: SpoIIE family protein phosphatase, partial [Clostridia bacterium]|nr:SpoIIE family protein phosphatase [Clostridia bacterium]
QETVSDQVFPGDMIILASDGLLDMDAQEEGQWLSRVIGQAVVNNPQNMAEYLLDKVISISNGKIKDDITVMVAQVGEVA